MDGNTLMVFVGIAIIGFIILRIIFKTGLKILGSSFAFGAIVVAVLIATGKLDMNNFHISASDFKFMKLDQKYCGTQGIDKVICDCIIKPLDEKIHARYTDSEIAELKKNKIKWLNITFKILNEHRDDFKRRLKERGAEKKWNEFINQFVAMGIDSEYKDSFNKLKDVSK